MFPEDIVQKTLNNNTHLYLSVEEENQQYPRGNYRYILPGLRYLRQRETVTSETFFLQLNHHAVIIFYNYLWGIYQIGGVYTPWGSKAKIGLPCKIT